MLTSYTNEDLDARQRPVPRRGHRRRPGALPRRPAHGPAPAALRPDGPGERGQGLAADPHRRRASRSGRSTWATDVLLWSRTAYDPDADFSDGELRGDLVVIAFDRSTRTWSTTSWPDLPAGGLPAGGRSAPTAACTSPCPATAGQVPEGGWPTGPDGEADDADAQGDTSDLWSVSLDRSRRRPRRGADASATSPSPTPRWCGPTRTNGDSGMVHVRDLATGEETLLRPQARRAVQPAVLRGDRRPGRDGPVLRHLRGRRA